MSEALPVAPHVHELGDPAGRTATEQVTLVPGVAAFVSQSAKLAIPCPITPVPLTLQTVAVLLTPTVLGSTRGVI